MADAAEAKWYVVHTYSGYESKVKTDIEKTIKNRHLEDSILEVLVPMQDVVEFKNGIAKSVPKKMFPGYVFIHMVKNDVTWYLVRNTRGVTGFVGSDSKEPKPLEDSEIERLFAKEEKVQVDFEIGDMVEVTSGGWVGRRAVVADINIPERKVTITAELFGRETPVELDFSEIKKV